MLDVANEFAMLAAVANEFATRKTDCTDNQEVRVPRPVSSQPTEVELQILRILWSTGGATAREIHNELARLEGRERVYSTTVKMLSVMLAKGLVRRDEAANPHVYRAAAPRRATQRRMLGHLIEQVYDGSALSLVMQALSSKRPTQAELDEVRRFLDECQDRPEGESPKKGKSAG